MEKSKTETNDCESSGAGSGVDAAPGGFGPAEKSEAAALIKKGLAEDVPDGDLTTEALLAVGTVVRAEFRSRADGVVCGLPVVAELFRQLEPAISLRPYRSDGDRVDAGSALLEVVGPVQPVLRGERLALNFLQRLSGIATATRRAVDAVRGTDCKIFDTRKTTPGWRILEKYAVRAGGGRNHRRDLSESALIKDNHRAILRWLGDVSMASWVKKIRAVQSGARVEIEIDSLDELDEALAAGADIVLLDNFSLDELIRAVGRTRAFEGKPPLLEASGGITLANARDVALTGVDRIALGAITHSAPALDVGLDLIELAA